MSVAAIEYVGPSLPELRPYQAEDFAKLRSIAGEVRRERGRESGLGLLAVAPCGYGKTLLELYASFGTIGKGGTALFVAHREELINQPVEKLNKIGWYGIRVIKGGRVEGDPNAPITVASVQTLRARNYVPDADTVILDEARHYVAPDWRVVASANPRATILGFDATPMRSDGSPLGDCFQRLVQLTSMATLIRDGWLVPVRVIGPASYRKELSDTPLGAYQAHASGMRCIVYCRSIAHAEQTAAEFCAAGIPAEAVSQRTKKHDRRRALDRVRSGETLVLTNCMLFTEGLDLEELECALIARTVSDEAMWIQIGGRPARLSKHTGKRSGRVVDLLGHLWKYGFLEDERTWSLEGVPVVRTEDLPSAVQCRACWAWHRGGGLPCPQCGAMLPLPPPPKMNKRQLREYERSQIPRVGKDWDLFRTLVEEQRASGRKPQWVTYEFERQRGKKPAWLQSMVPAAEVTV